MSVDKEKLKSAIRLFLEAIGENPDREGLKETPDRIVRLWEEFKSYETFNMTVFEEVGNYDEMIVVKDIQFYSLCEHHLLPFFGKVHVGYIPNGKVCGLSKLVRVVNKFSYRPQVQERLTSEIAEFLEKELNPRGVAVVIEAEHLCYSSDTEILTDKGWKYFKDLNPDDKVAQVNSETLEMSFTKPLAYIKYPFKGNMIHFESKSIDLLVSPDHKMLYSFENIFNKGKNIKWEIGKAHKIKDLSNIIIPQASVMKGKEIEYINLENDNYHEDSSVLTEVKTKTKIKADTFIKFLAVYLLNGSLHIEKGKQYKVFILQKGIDDIEKIKNVLKELPFEFDIIQGEDNSYNFVINSEILAKYLENFGKSNDKYIPEFLYSVSERQKRLFLEYLIDKDLNLIGENYTFVSSSKKFIDGLQILYATIGISTTVSSYKDGGNILYKLEIKRDKFYSPVHNISEVPYNDYIYSLTVEDGFLLVRRNNKVAISGNCMSMRGVKNPSSYTITSKLTGKFRDDEKTRNEFLNLINRK